MDLILNNILIPIENDGPAEYATSAARILNLETTDFSLVKILSKALDLSDTEQIKYKLSFVVRVGDDFKNKQKLTLYFEDTQVHRPILPPKDRPIIIGFGPAGMFAALELIGLGVKPVIFERGKRIEDRTRDVGRFINDRILNPESNIQFGEGGAGSFSDGKLFSRRNNNSSPTNKVLKTFAKFGAPAEIEYISKPHLGTDVLCKIVRNIRDFILERGGEIHFESKLTDILISDGVASGVVINDAHEFYSSNIYLALGHSARDTLEVLETRGVLMEQRPISIGVRIEHPAETINLMRYGEKYQNYPALGAATYSLNYTDRSIKRGVYTFCMCPGGEIVNASSSEGMLVVNGMSYSRRSSPFSNAALVASCHVDDYPTAGPLAGIEFQKDIERKAFAAGGGNWMAPAQNLMNFLGKSGSTELVDHSFKMGCVPADMADVFPDYFTDLLMAAFKKWEKQVPLFIAEQAIIVGPESRTSSPLRILRDENFQSVNVKGLYPIGEGSGYTGGITSSAADAIKAVARNFLHQ